MPKPIIKDIDHGYNRVRDVYTKPGQSVVDVGVLGKEGTQKREDGLTNVLLAGVHEFGARINHPGGTPFTMSDSVTSSRSGGTAGVGRAAFLPKGSAGAIGVTKPHVIDIPARSWNRAWVDENEGKVRQWIREFAKRVEQGEITRQQALGQLGELIAAGMKQRIKSGIAPALKQSTINRKGSSTPLIDTGIMINSITYKVRRSKAEGTK